MSVIGKTQMLRVVLQVGIGMVLGASCVLLLGDCRREPGAARETVANEPGTTISVSQYAKICSGLISQVVDACNGHDYETARVAAESLCEIDAGTGVAALLAAYEGAETDERLRKRLVGLQFIVRVKAYLVWLGTFQALEARGELDGARDVLETHRRTIPADLHDYLLAGLLAMEGKNDEAASMLDALKEDQFWARFVDGNPLYIRTFGGTSRSSGDTSNPASQERPRTSR